MLSGDDPFDEATMLDDAHGTSRDADAEAAPASSEPATPGDGATRT